MTTVLIAQQCERPPGFKDVATVQGAVRVPAAEERGGCSECISRCDSVNDQFLVLVRCTLPNWLSGRGAYSFTVSNAKLL